MILNWKKVLGIVLLIFGGFIIFSKESLTGAVIGLEEPNYFGIFGIAVFVAGIVLLFFARKREEKEGLEGKFTIIRTRRFEKAIKGYDLDKINRTAAKIGTGLGKEEKLKGRPDFFIRESGGGRIFFEYDPEHTTAILTDYTPDHRY